MGHLKKVSKGQPIRDAFRPEAWNQMVEDTNLARQRLMDLREAFGSSSYPHPDVIDLQNGTGADLGIAAVVSLGNPIIGPTTDLDTFQQRPNLIGITPPVSPSATLFAVTLEPIVANVGDGTGGIGRAAIAGACAVQVNFGTVTDGFARPTSGNTGNLISDPTTGVPILWPRPAAATGLQWALVALGGMAGGSTGAIKCVVTVFTANATFTPNANTLWFDVELIGGGGAGGGGSVLAPVYNTFGMVAGGGGGGGGYARLTVNPPLAASYAVTVGLGGTPTAGAGGGAGQTSSIVGGILASAINVQATGGQGGGLSQISSTSSSYLAPGGAGGIGAGGDVNAKGHVGQPGIAGLGGGGTFGSGNPLSFGGMGGAGFFGGEGYVDQNGNTVTPQFGGGGGGRLIAFGSSGVSAGLPGAAGVVIVREYRSA